jgi:acetolactate synthase-1/2/3 large subunit
VLLDIPKNVQTEKAEFIPCDKQECRPQPQPSEEDIEDAVKLIREAQRPYIYCGGGVVISGLKSLTVCR